ncbi:MAG: LytTR family DNA-binding domain-containing protein [Bacteroidota bacterium]
MIKYLIIDDEYMAHNIIKGYCDLLPNLELQKNCYDALEALDYLRDHTVDLIFLDLNMPRLKGFDFLKTLAAPPKVIVTTAYQEYALEGYELNISDYLLKPFSFERFLKAVNKATSAAPTVPVPTITGALPVNRSIFLRENKKYLRVEIKHILFLESAGNYTKVVTSVGTITTREKISDLLTTFADPGFLQVHKSFAIATAYIRSIEGNRITIGDHLIPIGKQFKANVTDLLR